MRVAILRNVEVDMEETRYDDPLHPVAVEPSTTLDAVVASRIATGARVESRTSTSAVLVKGRTPNHVLHVILSVISFTLWFWFVYMWILALNGWAVGERREALTVNEDGSIWSTKSKIFGIGGTPSVVS
jgi:hypothetical protein